jgi:hypothetical protein
MTSMHQFIIIQYNSENLIKAKTFNVDFESTASIDSFNNGNVIVLTVEMS